MRLVASWKDGVEWDWQEAVHHISATLNFSLQLLASQGRVTGLYLPFLPLVHTAQFEELSQFFTQDLLLPSFVGFYCYVKLAFILILMSVFWLVEKSSTFILGKSVPKSEFPLLWEAERRSELYLDHRKACSSSHPQTLPRIPFLFSEPVSCRSGL